MLADRATRRAHRAALVGALRQAPAGAVFCDLGLGRTLQSRGPAIPVDTSTVAVCHQTNAIDPGPDGRRRAGRRANLRVLRSLGRHGVRFVVHTEGAAARLAAFVPAEHVQRLGWPVVARDDPCLTAPAPPSGTVTLLFAGSARMEKGLPALLRAVRGVRGFDRLVVPGRIPPDALRALDRSDTRVELWNRWLPRAEYTATLREASIVVLPYREGYLRHGVFSSVMAEAMARGRPLVVSAALGHLLPAGYRGAVVAADESDAALTRALQEGVERRVALEAVAMTDGRAHVRAHHSYEAYLDGIVRAGVAARRAAASR
jgi:glycosyltransferase involved in cell wall biosynthesis